MRTFLILALSSGLSLADETLDERLQRADELLRRGAYREAQTQLSQVLRSVENAKPSRLLVTVLNNLAGIQADLDNYRDAEKLYLRSLHVWERLEGPDRPPRLSIHQNLLIVYLQAGWTQRAERLLRQVSVDLVAATPQQRLQFLDCTGNLRRAQKRFDEATVCFREALQLAHASGQVEVTGFLWNSLGVVQADAGRLTEAILSFGQAVSSHERSGRLEHPALIAPLTNLGGTYLAENQLVHAQAALQRALRLAEQLPGDSHPALYRILMLEAKMYHRMNRKADAKQARERAQSIGQKVDRLNRAKFLIDIDDLRRK